MQTYLVTQMKNDNERIQLDEIGSNSLANSVSSSLVKKYENREGSSYLASSKEIVKTSSKALDSQSIHDIFKSKSKYYAGIKSVKTSLKHVEIFISPRLARDMLQFSQRGAVNKNNKNRKLSRSKVNKYAEAMMAGRWCLTGEPIIISDDGEILNGHHRLQACLEAGVGFISTVTYGVIDDLSFAHIDVGNMRSRAQVLEMSGVKVSAQVLSRVAMLAKAFNMTKNKFDFRGTQGTSFQPAEILNYVEEHEELALSVDFASTIVKRHKLESQISEPIYAFAHYLIKQNLKQMEFDRLPITPEVYLTRVISGLGLNSEDDIEYQVRNYLQSLVRESTSYALLCKLSSIFKGWNLHLNIPVAGNKVTVRRVAQYKKDGDGNKLPLPSAGNINEAFTIPCLPKGATPKRILKQSNIHIKK